MEHPEASPFESSEILARFVASTPLLPESWRLCDRSNTEAPDGFLTEEVGGVIYVAFSGVQSVPAGILEGDLVPLCDGESYGLFPGSDKQGGTQGNGDGKEKGVAMVHAGFLNLFRSICNSPDFQNQMFETVKKEKPLVLTGHSIGGAIASLSTLWLLHHLQLQSTFPPLTILCITFGSPLLGNTSLSRAILQKSWTGNFCHVVSKHDILPRLLVAPLVPCTPLLHALLRFWHSNMIRPSVSNHLEPFQLSEPDKSELFRLVLHHTQDLARNEGTCTSLFWPFGNYLFCSDNGAVCIDDGAAVVQMLHLAFSMGSPSSSIEDHLKYGSYVGKLSSQFFNKRSFIEDSQEELPESSYEAGAALALWSLGISSHHEVVGHAKACLKMARPTGRTPTLNCARLAIDLSKINPLRAQIEWYLAKCGESSDQLGYYDSFKRRGASRREHRVNTNRIRLGQFWDSVIEKMETNQLPSDLHRREKWVYASQFYKLLVEPLDIAEYYRNGMHREKGHYIEHGRERRYVIFDKWWENRETGREQSTRSNFASLTQDTCFWARVEEAHDWLEKVRSENDPSRLSTMWGSIDEFDRYARKLIEKKEVSKDVLAKNSSYQKWVGEVRALRLQSGRFPPLF